MPPNVPPWFTPHDPWLTRRMRDMVEIEAGEREVLAATAKAIAAFLDEARAALLGEPLPGQPPLPQGFPAEPSELTAAAEDRGPDFDAWPDSGAWYRKLAAFFFPALEKLFTGRFTSEVSEAESTVDPYRWRQSYLGEVWSRLKLWPAEAWDDIRPELQEAISQGEDHRQQRERVGRVLRIDAPARRIEAEINHLTKTVEDPEKPSSVRREARARRARLYRAKDVADSRWQFYAARIARTETVGALNSGTFYGAQAYQQATGEVRYKQWWCLHPDTPVQVSGATWVARRHHRGEMIRLTTASGVELRVTPEHPLLTAGGWTPAGELTLGTRVTRLPLGHGGGEAIGKVVDECLRLAEQAGQARTVRRTVGCREHVVDAAPANPIPLEGVFPAKDTPLAELARTTTDVRLPALAAASMSVRAGRRVARAELSEGMTAAGALNPDEITAITVETYDGPVYDFTTLSGFFAAGGLIVHNSTSDNRVRPSHWAAHMQVRRMDEKFRVGGHHLDHPGDPTGPAHEVINCRCSLLTMGKDEADRERERYEKFLPNRHDIHGNRLDEDGRPITAAAEPPDPGQSFAPDSVRAEAESGAYVQNGTTRKADPMTDTLVDVVADEDAAHYAADPPATPDVPGPEGEATLTWRGVLAPLNVPSADGRRIDAPGGGELLTRDMPLPLLFQEKLSPGHDDAVQGLANILSASIQDGAYVREHGLVGPEAPVTDDAQYLVGEGTFDAADPEAVKLAGKVRDGYLRWTSVDLDKVGRPTFHKYAGDEDLGPLELAEDEIGLPGLLIELGAALNEEPALAGQFGVEAADDGRVTGVAHPSAALDHFARAAGHPSTIVALRTDAGFRARFGVELGEGEEIVEAVDRWRLMSATLVSQPAFPQAYITMAGAGAPIVDEAALAAFLDANPVPEEVMAALPAEEDEAALALVAAVTGDTALPLGDRDRPWSASAAHKRLTTWATSDGKLDPAQFGRAHLWRDPDGDPKALDSYQFPFADIVNGTLTVIPRGVFAAAGRLDSASIPDADKPKIQSRLTTLYGRIREKTGDEAVQPPWQGGKDQSRKPIPRERPTTVVVAPKKRKAKRMADLGSEALTAAAESWAHKVAEVAAGLYEPPAEFFEDPQLPRPTNITVLPNGRVFGHVHDWTTSHIGFSGRNVRAPRSKSGYAHFNLKPVRCNDGSYVRCGALTVAKTKGQQGHAGTGRDWSPNRATDHYDNACHRVARVRAGADEHGTWISGALVPGVTPEQVLDLAELTCSGDWRGGELVAALMVNVPGLPIVEGDEAEPLALVAAGVIPREELGIGEFITDPEALTVDAIAEAVVARLDARELATREAAAQAAAQTASEEAASVLAERTWGARVEMLSARVYGPRAARLAARVNQRQGGRSGACADVAAAG